MNQEELNEICSEHAKLVRLFNEAKRDAECLETYCVMLNRQKDILLKEIERLKIRDK